MGGAAVVEPARGPMPVSPAEARSAQLVGRKPTSYLAELGSPSGFECTTPHRTTPDTKPSGVTQFRSSWRVSPGPRSRWNGYGSEAGSQGMGGAVVVEPARGPMPVSPAEARSARLVGRKPTSYLAKLGSPSGFECTTGPRTHPDTQPAELTHFRSSAQ